MANIGKPEKEWFITEPKPEERELEKKIQIEREKKELIKERELEKVGV